MPQKQVQVKPSPSIIQKLLGRVMSSSTEKSWPELSTEWASRQINMPNETAATNRVMEMDPISKYMYPDAYAVTGPLGTIGLNRKLIEQDKQNLGDVLTHELTHVAQGKREGLFKHVKNIVTADKDYVSRPYEKEAFDAEQNRKVIRNDIQLPAPKKIETGPSKRIR